MSIPLQDRLEQAITNLRSQQERLRTFQTELAGRRTTVTSKNRMIEATVDATGTLVSLSFKGNRFRSLAPGELGSLVVKTIAQAQQQARSAVLSAATGLMPEGFDLPGLDPGGVDLDEMFDRAVAMVRQPVLQDLRADSGTEPAGPQRASTEPA